MIADTVTLQDFGLALVVTLTPLVGVLLAFIAAGEYFDARSRARRRPRGEGFLDRWANYWKAAGAARGEHLRVRDRDRRTRLEWAEELVREADRE